LIPSARPPHKKDSGLAPAEDRLAMARLAAATEPGIEVSSMELERTGPSYTVDTLRAFRAAQPDAEIYFIIGADTLPELKTWKESGALFSLATFAVCVRPGFENVQEPGAKAVAVAIEPDAVSATEIRARVREGKPIDGLVPDAVRDYIGAHHLYREKANQP
jgi:nicotinate-nucleotide adenylyltransferase